MKILHILYYNIIHQNNTIDFFFLIASKEHMAVGQSMETELEKQRKTTQELEQKKPLLIERRNIGIQFNFLVPMSGNSTFVEVPCINNISFCRNIDCFQSSVYTSELPLKWDPYWLCKLDNQSGLLSKYEACLQRYRT